MRPGSREERAIGVGDGTVAAGGDFVFVTFALGSCVGLTLWDPQARVGGMLHSQLPVSYGHEARAAEHPFLFTDVGVAELLRELYKLGGSKRRIVAKLAGCAERTTQAKNSFRVGQRNLAVARRVLWKNDIVIAGEDVGGDVPRTLYLDMGNGETIVRVHGQHTTL